MINHYEFYRGDIIPPTPEERASRAAPSGLAARLVLKGRELSARDLSAGAADGNCQPAIYVRALRARSRGASCQQNQLKKLISRFA
jgi:hypothetical protein